MLEISLPESIIVYSGLIGLLFLVTIGFFTVVEYIAERIEIYLESQLMLPKSSRYLKGVLKHFSGKHEYEHARRLKNLSDEIFHDALEARDIDMRVYRLLSNKYLPLLTDSWESAKKTPLKKFFE